MIIALEKKGDVSNDSQARAPIRITWSADVAAPQGNVDYAWSGRSASHFSKAGRSTALILTASRSFHAPHFEQWSVLLSVRPHVRDQQLSRRLCPTERLAHRRRGCMRPNGRANFLFLRQPLLCRPAGACVLYAVRRKHTLTRHVEQ